MGDFPGMGVGDGPMPSHDKVPNLKLVMNPEGKLHDWTDLPEEEVPEMAQVATGGNPDAAHAMVENLQACKGRDLVAVRVRFTPPPPPPSNKTIATSFSG